MVVDKVFKIYCIIMDNSYTKYLKYKKKYIDLKSQIDNNKKIKKLIGGDPINRYSRNSDIIDDFESIYKDEQNNQLPDPLLCTPFSNSSGTQPPFGSIFSGLPSFSRSSSSSSSSSIGSSSVLSPMLPLVRQTAANSYGLQISPDRIYYDPILDNSKNIIGYKYKYHDSDKEIRFQKYLLDNDINPGRFDTPMQIVIKFEDETAYFIFWPHMTITDIKTRIIQSLIYYNTPANNFSNTTNYTNYINNNTVFQFTDFFNKINYYNNNNNKSLSIFDIHLKYKNLDLDDNDTIFSHKMYGGSELILTVDF